MSQGREWQKEVRNASRACWEINRSWAVSVWIPPCSKDRLWGYKGAGLHWKPDVLVCAASNRFSTKNNCPAELIHLSRFSVRVPLVHLVKNVSKGNTDLRYVNFPSKKNLKLDQNVNGTYLFVWGHGKWSNPSFFFLSHVLPHSVAFFSLLSCVSLSVLSLTPSQRLFLSASLSSSFFFYCCVLQQLNQLLKDAITAHVHKRMNAQKTIKKNEWIMYILCIYFLPCVSLFSSVSLETLRALVLLRTVTLKFHIEKAVQSL